MKITPEYIEERIKLDHSRDALLTEFGKKTLSDRYTQEGESYQHVFARASLAFSGGDLELAQRLYDYSSKLWLSYATPLISNGGTGIGLPISCFLNYVDDSIDGLVNNFSENAYLSTSGGGIGSYFGHVRSVGETTSKGVDTPGAMPFMHTIDGQMLAYHQGRTRRGSAAFYMDVSHPEIIEFIEMRSPTGGDIHRKNLNSHHGVCVPDAFMNAVLNNTPWDLVDPHSGNVKNTVSARDLFIRILMQRVKLGEPYIFFTDAAQRALPETLKKLGLTVFTSNLCTEITLPVNKDRTAVCCLSSINVAKRNEWKPVVDRFLLDIATMLDNALNVFIEDAPATMWRAVASAKSERSIGIGTLGYQTYIQSEGFGYSHKQAYDLNKEVYAEINAAGMRANRILGKERGEAPDMAGTGLRFAHVFAIAPNASSSIICGSVSPSVEPYAGNAYVAKTLSGSGLMKNPALIPVLKRYGKDTDEVWNNIAANGGSVQHLDFLTLWEKEVFKTFLEEDQMHLIRQAGDRQKYICQAQSINIAVPANVQAKYLYQLHILAWKVGLKSLYYCRSQAVRKTETVSAKVERIKRDDAPQIVEPEAYETCEACSA